MEKIEIPPRFSSAGERKFRATSSFETEPSCLYFQNGICPACTCTKCGKSGLILHRDGSCLSAHECSCLKSAYSLYRLRKQGLDAAVQRCSFDSFRTPEPWQKKIKDAAMAFARRGGSSWFFIGGQSGSGKTHLCTAILNELVGRGSSFEYFRWVEDGGRLKTLSPDCGEERDAELKRIRRRDVLYIDDFLKLPPSEADRRLAFELIDGAYSTGRRVILSSERGLQAINAWDRAVAGRIRERAGADAFTLAGEEKNYRMKSE